MLNTTVIIIGMALGIIFIAYLATVALPLLGIIKGGYKVLRIKRAEKKLGRDELVAFHKKLGFTMADGGERNKEK